MFSLWTYIMLKPNWWYARERERDGEKDRRCAKVWEKDSGRRGRQIGCLTAVGPRSAGSPACIHGASSCTKYARHCLMIHTCCKRQMNWPRKAHVSLATGWDEETPHHQTLTASRSWNIGYGTVSGEQVSLSKKKERAATRPEFNSTTKLKHRVRNSLRRTSVIIEEERKCRDASVKRLLRTFKKWLVGESRL